MCTKVPDGGLLRGGRSQEPQTLGPGGHGADAQDVESRVSVQDGVTVRDWRHQRLPQKLTKVNLHY